MAEFGVYGKTIHTLVYSADTKKRYVHIYYSAAKTAGERAGLEESIQEMQSYLKRFQDTEHEFGPAFRKFFHLHYNNDTGHFVYGDPKLQVIRDELHLRRLHRIKYRLDHAVSKTQKVVLSAFGIRAEQVKYKSNYISESLKGK